MFGCLTRLFLFVIGAFGIFMLIGGIIACSGGDHALSTPALIAGGICTGLFFISFVIFERRK